MAGTQGTISYSFTLPAENESWLPKLTNDVQPLPQWARTLLTGTVLPAWELPTAENGGGQAMHMALAAGERSPLTDDEVKAWEAVYTGAQGSGPKYRERAGTAVGANVVFAFADFGSAFVQSLLEDNLWPGRPPGAKLPGWSQRTKDLELDAEGNILGGRNGAEVLIDGTLGVWIPAQVMTPGGRVFIQHDIAMDLVLFNSKVNWNRTANAPGDKQIDFVSVALHETGHDLGLDHARAAPEPATPALVIAGLGLAGLATSRRRSRRFGCRLR
jgi:hypothetical protein